MYKRILKNFSKRGRKSNWCIANSEEKLQELLETVKRESKKRGLTINVKKTECMVIKKEKEKTQCKVKIGDEEIKQVEKFNYLGSLITSDGKCDSEIKKRIAMAKDTFEKLSNIFKD